jgi:hypothetical protein
MEGSSACLAVDPGSCAIPFALTTAADHVPNRLVALSLGWPWPTATGSGSWRVFGPTTVEFLFHELAQQSQPDADRQRSSPSCAAPTSSLSAARRRGGRPGSNAFSAVATRATGSLLSTAVPASILVDRPERAQQNRTRPGGTPLTFYALRENLTKRARGLLESPRSFQPTRSRARAAGVCEDGTPQRPAAADSG